MGAYEVRGVFTIFEQARSKEQAIKQALEKIADKEKQEDTDEIKILCNLLDRRKKI
jgi:hypothetical protein